MKLNILHLEAGIDKFYNSNTIPDKLNFKSLLVSRIIRETSTKDNFDLVYEKCLEIVEEENEREISSFMNNPKYNNFVLSAFKGETQIRIADENDGGEDADDFFICEFL